MLVCTVVSFSVSFVVLTLLSILAPADYVLVVEDRDRFGQETEVRGKCELEDSFPYLVVLATIHLGVFIFAFLEAWKARNLSMEYAESSYVFLAMMAIVVVSFVGVPLLFLAGDNPSAMVFLGGAIVFVASSSILLLTFVPKLRYHWKQQKGDRRTKCHITGLEQPRKPASQWSVADVIKEVSERRAETSNRNQQISHRNQQISHRNQQISNRNQQISNRNQQIFNRNPEYVHHSWKEADPGSESFKGMRILTTKTVSELLQDNEELERENALLYDAVAKVQQVVESSEDVAMVREKLLSVVLNEDECGCSMETDPILQREPSAAAAVEGLSERSSEH